jgi:hypothetical protein
MAIVANTVIAFIHRLTCPQKPADFVIRLDSDMVLRIVYFVEHCSLYDELNPLFRGTPGGISDCHAAVAQPCITSTDYRKPEAHSLGMLSE